MELLPTANLVMRAVVPRMLESAGRGDCARAMREVGPVTDARSLVRAARELSRLRQLTVAEPGELRDVLFWAEAAAWAAVRSDLPSLRDHVWRLVGVVAKGSARAVRH